MWGGSMAKEATVKTVGLQGLQGQATSATFRARQEAAGRHEQLAQALAVVSHAGTAESHAGDGWQLRNSCGWGANKPMYHCVWLCLLGT